MRNADQHDRSSIIQFTLSSVIRHTTLVIVLLLLLTFVLFPLLTSCRIACVNDILV